jgi:hypothetical protein
MTGQHDIGGLPAGPVDTGDGEPSPWQKMITAVYGAMVSRGHGNVDEMRRVLEDLTPEQYDQPYYERWVEAILISLEEKNLLSVDEVEARMAKIRSELGAAE